MAGRDWTWMLVLAAGLLPACTAWADPHGPEVVKLDNQRLQPGLYPVAPGSTEAPGELAHPPFQLDWSIGLKGSYTSSSTEGNNFLTTLTPAFTARREGRTDIVLSGDADIDRPWEDNGEIGVTALRLGVSTETALNSNTRLNGNAAFTLSQPLPNTPGLNPLVDVPPQVLSGSAGLGLDRSFGKINLGLKGNVERSVYGATIRSDSGFTDNSHQNVWQADASLRAGFQVTPIFEVFGEAAMGRDMFDAVSPSLGVSTDATSTALRGGIAGRWNGIVSASASIGLGRHDFDAAGLSDVTTQLYDARLTYSPDPTVNLTASLSTNVEPTGPDANGTARISHVVGADFDYTINSWLRLRASADWGRSTLEGSGETERRHGAGAGADYALNAHTALAADYAYSHRDNSSSGIVEAHTISLGVTMRR